jgi:hypothetical protein
MVLTVKSFEGQGKKKAAQLHQKAALLQMTALGLLRLDPALPSHREYGLSLLAALFLPVRETLPGVGKHWLCVYYPTC